MTNSKFISAILLQFSGIVGAGIFALPSLFVASNFWFATIGLVLLSLITGIINLFYIDIINHTSGDHQLSGYAGIYLNQRFRYLAALNLFLSGLGALFAYIKLGANFVSTLTPLNLTLSTFLFIFLLLFAFLFQFFKKNSIFNFLPLLTIFIPIILFSLVFQFSLPSLVFSSPNLSFFGATVFALSGFTIIPEVEEVLRGESHAKIKFKTASILGLVLATLLYFFFAFAIAKLSGPYLSSDSVSGLKHISLFLAQILSIFGLLVIFKGSLNFLTVFKEIFYRDFKINQKVSLFLSLLFPFLALTLSRVSFIQLLSLIGSVNIFVSVIIICLIRLRLPQKPSFLLLFLVLFTFIIGVVFTIFL